MLKKEKLSKVGHIIHAELKAEKYLKADDVQLAKFAFMARCRMLDVRANFKGKYKELDCPLGCKEEDTQKHLITCNVLANNELSVGRANYEDLFSKDSEKILATGKLLKSKFDKRSKLLKNPQNANVGQVNLQLCSAV